MGTSVIAEVLLCWRLLGKGEAVHVRDREDTGNLLTIPSVSLQKLLKKALKKPPAYGPFIF